MLTKKFIPSDKGDDDFINVLRNTPISEVKPYFMDLLEWTQDMNWPVAHYLFDYFTAYYREVEDKLIIILKGNDAQWKYAILIGIISSSTLNMSSKMEQTLRYLVNNLSKEDKEAGLDEIILDILNNPNST